MSAITQTTANATLLYEDTEGASEQLSAPVDFLFTVATLKYIKGKQNIGNSEEAIKIGELTSLGEAIFINRDTVNSIDLKTGTGGTIFARLQPNGGSCRCYLGSGAQAPYAISSASTCQMEYMICSQ